MKVRKKYSIEKNERLLSIEGMELASFRRRLTALIIDITTCFISVERSLAYGASVFELGIGFFQFFKDTNSRMSQDFLAETIVIREKKKIK